jgi:hypothetical protein
LHASAKRGLWSDGYRRPRSHALLEARDSASSHGPAGSPAHLTTVKRITSWHPCRHVGYWSEGFSAERDESLISRARVPFGIDTDICDDAGISSHLAVHRSRSLGWQGPLADRAWSLRIAVLAQRMEARDAQPNRAG